MRTVTYEEGGKKYLVAVPDNATQSQVKYGIRLGPPDLDSLELPEELQTRLHNELFARGLFTYTDARKRRNDIIGAWQAALRVDAERVVQVFSQPELANGKVVGSAVDVVTKKGRR